MSKNISSERKCAYYFGMALMIIGGLLFASNFLILPMSVGGAGPGNAGNMMAGMAGRAIGGMALLIIGGFIRGVGARGLAGSGVVLDPQQARRDLEPYSRMAGGMVKDAIDESGIELGSKRGSEAEKVIMVRCRECGKLNEEDSKFCQECGKPI